MTVEWGSLTLSLHPKYLLLCTPSLTQLQTAIHWDAAWRQENISGFPPFASQRPKCHIMIRVRNRVARLLLRDKAQG